MRVLCLSLVLVLVGCQGTLFNENADAGDPDTDAGPPPAGVDAGAPPPGTDAGLGVDSGAPPPGTDAGLGVDAGAPPPGTDAGLGVDAGGPPPGVDAGPMMCPGTQMLCGTACVDTQTSRTHCGMCNRACPGMQICEMGGCVDPPVCPGAPAGADVEAAAALALTNNLRVAMGIPCQAQIATINLAAERHCQYYVANTGMCIANAHREVATCSMFTGVNFSDRMRAAGYTGSPRFEDMHFVGNGTAAVQGWVDSVWHRTPVLSPWVGEHGYGRAGRCDTMDFGRGTIAPTDTIATYPYDGETNVPRSFNGREGPPPPMPPTGWPSGYPIHLYIQGATLTTHTLTVDGSSTNIPHIWLTPADSTLLSTEFVIYAHDSLAAATTYRVTATGTRGGSPVNISFTFTTR